MSTKNNTNESFSSRYKYENGNYYRKAANGSWFKVSVNRDGNLLWEQPDGKIVKDSRYKVPAFIATSNTPNGVQYRIATGSNGGLGYYNSLDAAISAYSNAKTKGAFSDPSENLLNDLTFDAFTGKGVINAVGRGIRMLPNAGKSFINAAKYAFSTPSKEVARKVATKTAENTIREAPRFIGGLVAAGGANKATKVLTGKSINERNADALTQHWGMEVTPTTASVINPIFWGGYGLTDRAIRRASFNHITPISYSDDVAAIPLSKKLEFMEIVKDIPKQIFNFKPIKVPAWRKRYNTSLAEHDLQGNEAFLDNREEAMRLVFGLPSRTGLYVKNKNGTYSYDLDKLYDENLPESGLIKTEEGYKYNPTVVGKNLAGDNLAWNGGYINYQEGNGVAHISDVFDVLPFIDAYRLPSLSFSPWMHRNLPEFEVFNALGGKPFTLEMTLPTLWY